jgi:hypothetical protein
MVAASRATVSKSAMAAAGASLATVSSTSALLSLLCHRPDHLHHRLLGHAAFVLEYGYLVHSLLAGHLCGHDLDLLVGHPWEAG